MTDQMRHILQIPLLLKWKQITLPPLHRHSIMNNPSKHVSPSHVHHCCVDGTRLVM